MRTRSFGSGSGRRLRPRSVWAALITAVVLCIAIVAGVLLPVLGRSARPRPRQAAC